MTLFKYTNKFINRITIVSIISLFFYFVSTDCAHQATPEYADNALVTLFADNVRSKAVEIYKRIPGTLIKFLDEKKIARIITFQDDISDVDIILGNEKLKSLDPFQRQLRQSLHLRLRESNVAEIRAEDLAIDIRNHYEAQMKGWAKPGEQLFDTIVYTGLYEVKNLQRWTKVSAHVYIEIVQECENNWINTNRYKFEYHLSIEISGITIDPIQAAKFTELLAKNNPAETIKQIESRFAVTWEDL